MRVQYTKHARERMDERGITDAEVLHCINEHHQSFTRADGKIVYLVEVAGRTLKVVTQPRGSAENRTFVIISVMWRDGDDN